MEHTSYHDLLNEEFERRKELNSSYSLRAFARDLGVSAPRLSQVLNKKQGLSVKAAQDISKKLKLNDKDHAWFCDSVGALHARSLKQKESYKEKFKIYKATVKSYTELQLEYFKVISDWYHFAILELTYLKDFKNDPKWIAEILDITTEEAELAISRMITLDLLELKKGKLVDCFKFLATPSDTPSASLKKFNTQIMKKAMEALYEQDVLEREITSNIFSIDKEQLPVFKEKLRNFRRELEADANQHKNKNSVYCLGMQFFELTRK